jgi:CBS domain containing-hemolysin-like protein
MTGSDRLGLEPTVIVHLLILALVLGASVFWVLMIIECATKEPAYGNEKIIWLLIIILTHWIGALIYYFVRRPQRIAELGA